MLGLNQVRLSEVGSVFRQADPIGEGYYTWVDTVNPYQLGYIVDGQVFVLMNVGSEAHEWENVVLPAGNWKLVGNNEAFDYIEGVEGKYKTLSGSTPHRLELPGKGVRVWVRE